MTATIATELIIEIRDTLIMLSALIDSPVMLLGDNMFVILSTTVISSIQKNKHCPSAYHRVREACAARILTFCHVKSHENIVDILTKLLDNVELYACT